MWRFTKSNGITEVSLTGLIFDGKVDRNPTAEKAGLKRPLIDYYRMLYTDTSTNGIRGTLRAGFF